jgi:putative SOS response-associated peptidase YedK
MPGEFPDYPAPVLRNTGAERELTIMRWGMPPPPRPGGRGWLKQENRCLVPANSFAEYAPEANPETKKKDVVWFAVNDDRPLFAFAGYGQSSKANAAPSQNQSPGLTWSTAS